MLLLILLIAILGLLVFASVLYMLCMILIVAVKKIRNKKDAVSFKANTKYNNITIPISICLSLLLGFYYLFSNTSHNLKTAYIERRSDKFIITMFGERNLMAHDPISLLKKDTYLDSIKFEISRSEGVIDGLEISSLPGYYKIVKGDAFVIHNKTMVVKLFYDDYDDKKIVNSVWNGDYHLEWRNK